jgi:aminoglycoside phosphotransferase (APT) family kinase protein
VDPGPLLASGRDADIFDLGDGRVLRRTKSGRSIEREATVMRHVVEHGYPAPAVHEVRADGAEIVMDRIDGPLMMDPMMKRPWSMPRLASALADLHDQLHAIPAPDWLPQLDDGDCVLHLDLHPLNVIMSPSGPVVIDWSNAARGDGLTDVASTYVLLTAPDMPGPRAVQVALQPARQGLGRAFAHRYRGRELDARIALAAELKTLDPNMSDTEVETLQKLATRMRKRAG